MPKRRYDKHDDRDFEQLEEKINKLRRKMKRARRRRKSSSDRDMQSHHKSPECKSVTNTGDIYEQYQAYSPGRSSWWDYSEAANGMQGGAPTHVVVADVHSPPSDARRPPTRYDAAAAVAEGAARPPHTAAPDTDIVAVISAAEAGPQEVLSLRQQANDIAGAASNTSDPQPLPEQIIELDSDTMDILGEDPTCTKDYGPDIQKDLAIRLIHIATSGLSKESRKEIKEKYLIPGNCKLVKAPSLNPEIRASLVESQVKRDKGIENKQIMTSHALSSLSTAITMLLTSNNKHPELLKPLMDTARILTDIQHSDSILRRFFILSTVKKDLKDQLEKTKIDEMLFGSNLAETLKSAKIISKSGADIRSASVAKPMAQTAPKFPGRPLNYRPPPISRRPAAAGATRGARQPPAPAQVPRPTTTRPMQHNASRTSWRQQPTRQRR